MSGLKRTVTRLPLGPMLGLILSRSNLALNPARTPAWACCRCIRYAGRCSIPMCVRLEVGQKEKGRLVMTGEFSIVRQDRFIEATRDSGYKGTGSALAELVDNAVQAQASSVI